ncbi:MAG: hypothetical protein JO336_04360 [Acidobacteriia bacterium]|nr:hypothetical protein [Terriglobia bacterium]MBV8905206.1 hypothetical protein [Terriglobia bacterium]
MRLATLSAALTGALLSASVFTPPIAAQTDNAAKTSSPGPAPRMPDGHPDLSGVWWRGADIGGRGGSPLPGRGGPAIPPFSSLYNPSAQAKAKALGDKDDPSLGCAPTSFGTLNVSLFDVGAVGQIVQTPKFVIMLTETYHGFQIIPFDGRSHRDNVPPSARGDAIGRWEGDTFVVDKTNFNDENWISAEGRVSFHSDAMHIVERYRRVDAKTLEIEATLEDPKVLTKPWVVPKQTLQLAPFDQIMELPCSGTEVQALINAAAQQSPAKR